MEVVVEEKCGRESEVWGVLVWWFVVEEGSGGIRYVSWMVRVEGEDMGLRDEMMEVVV